MLMLKQDSKDAGPKNTVHNVYEKSWVLRVLENYQKPVLKLLMSGVKVM